MTLGRSFKVGVIRLTERFVKSDPLSGRDERRLVKHLNREMGDYLDQVAGRGLRPRHRHVRHHPEPWRAGRRSEDAPVEELRNQRVARQGAPPAAQEADAA